MKFRMRHQAQADPQSIEDIGPKRRTLLPREEVRRMAKSTNLPIPPKMTKAEWRKRDRTKVTLTRGELDQLSRLVAAGHALLRGEPSISAQLRAAMTKLGIDTKGL